MKEPLLEEEQSPKVKTRFCIVRYAQKTSHIQKIQTDTDSSFNPQFTWHLSELCNSRPDIPPACQEAKGEVECSHKTDLVDLFRGEVFEQKGTLCENRKDGEQTTTKIELLPHQYLNRIPLE